MSDKRYPVVLAHGIARFDIFRERRARANRAPEGECLDGRHYFKGIKSRLEAEGFEVHHTSVDFAGPVGLRSRELSEQINRVLEGRGGDKVHIIAHSMGGLDARRMIVEVEGMAEKVASLTTVGTPHLGTTFADFGVSLSGKLIIDGLRPVINLEGFRDLTTRACDDFNRRARDREANNPVVYRTCASAEERDRVFLPLQPSWFIINRNEGDNDGLVSLKSQRWTRELVGNNGRRKKVEQLSFPVPADHLNEVGWWDHQEMQTLSDVFHAKERREEYEGKVRDFYVQLARSLPNN